MTHINGQNNVAVQAPPPPPAYGSMDQVNSGPAGLLYTLANDLIKIYNQLQKLYNEITVAETNVQATTITAGADAQRAASQNQAFSIAFEAAGAFAGAAITLGTSIAEGKSNLENSNAMKPQEEELNRLNDLDKLTPLQTDVVVAGGSETHPPAVPPPVDSDVLDRANSLRMDPAYLSADDRQLLQSDYEQLKEKNQEAVNAMQGPKEYETFKSNLQERISAKEKAVNTIQSRIQSTQSSFQQTGSIASNLINAGTSGGKAYFTNKSGQMEAVKQVNDGVTRLASGTADTTRQGIAQDYAKVSDVIASARAGAQAYAQT